MTSEKSPHRNLSPLGDLVREYLAPNGHGERLDAYLKFFKKRHLSEAIERAGLTIDGKVHSHQRLVGRKKLEQASKALLNQIDELKACHSFEELHQLVADHTGHIDGFGILARYDISLRIGARLGLWPEMVYLHAGARKGCKKLGVKLKGKTVEMAALPKPMQILKPYHAENFLCIYKNNLGRSERKPTACRPIVVVQIPSPNPNAVEDDKLASQRVADFFRRVHDECLPSIDRATLAFYGIQNERIVKDRSGVLFQIASTVFILTASHDLREIVQNKIPLYVGWNDRNDIPIPLHDAVFHTTESESRSGRKDVVRDVAAIKLSDESVKELIAGGRQPISLLDINMFPDRTPALFVMFGFPQAWFRVETAGPKCTPLVYGCGIYTGEHWDRAGIGYDPKVHLLLDFNRDAVMPSDGQSVILPGYDGIRGVSGCGIWRITSMDGSFRDWNASQRKLVAIQHRYYQQPAYIHTTWIRYAVRRIFDDYPELKAAAAIEYRR